MCIRDRDIIYALLILTVSAFCLTSLDTATRLARYMFQEFWVKPGEDIKDLTGVRKVLVNPDVYKRQLHTLTAN